MKGIIMGCFFGGLALVVRSIVLLMVMCFFIGNCAHAGTSPFVVKRKADEAVVQLKKYMDQGNDASLILPKMKRVKMLGQAKKFDEANVLLDEILLFFEQHEKKPESVVSNTGPFINDQRVEIRGYDSDAMEAFISRDGKYLFFNNEGKNKDIFYASKVDDYTFQFLGEVKNINTPAVDGVPTLDRFGNFYYVSTNKYSLFNKTTVYSGVFKNGAIHNIKKHPSLVLGKAAWLNMDSEISADGKTLYSTQSYFGEGKSFPTKSYFILAHKNDKGKFVIDTRSEEIFKNINDGDIVYGATISSDDREILYTKLTEGFTFESYVALRSGKGQAFDKPVLINAITGFSEAPALTDDGKMIYYHKKGKDGKFYIHALHRNPDYKWN